EALNSICAISQSTQITTRTALDPVAISYDLDKSGTVIRQDISKPAGTTSSPGTTVLVHKLFHNLPVRRQQAQKTVPATTKRVHDLLTAYSLVHPHIRFAVKNVPETAGTKARGSGTGVAGDWVKPAVDGTVEAVRSVFGGEMAGTVGWWVEGEGGRESEEDEDEEKKEEDKRGVRIEAVLARVDANPTVACRGDRVFVYVNDRPVSYSRGEMKRVVAMVRDKYAEAVERRGDEIIRLKTIVSFAPPAIPRKTPFTFLNFKIPPSSYDVNVEPSKNVVLLHHPQRILDVAERLLERVYGAKDIRKVAGAETSVQAHIPTPSPTGFAPTTHDHVISTDGFLADTQNVTSPPTTTVPTTPVPTIMVPTFTIPAITAPATPQSPKQTTAEVVPLTPPSAPRAFDDDGAWHFSMIDEASKDTLEEVPRMPVDTRKPMNLAKWAGGLRAGDREKETSECPTSSLIEHMRSRCESEAAVPSIHDNNDDDDNEPLEDRRLSRAKQQQGNRAEAKTKPMAARMVETGVETIRTPRRERKAGLDGGRASWQPEASDDADDAGRRVRRRIGESIERRGVEDDEHGTPLSVRQTPLKESAGLAVKVPPPTARTAMEKQTPPPAQSSSTCPGPMLYDATRTAPREDSVVPASTQSSNPGHEAIIPAASPLPSSTSGVPLNALAMLRREPIASASHTRPALPVLPRRFTHTVPQHPPSHQPALSLKKPRPHSRLINFTKLPSTSTLHEHAVFPVLPVAAARSRYGRFRDAWVRGYRVGMTGYVGLEERDKGKGDARVAGRVGETHWVVGWIGAGGRCVSVGVVDGKRAKEVVVYRDLLSQFDLSPKQQLDHPIQLTISVDDLAYSALLHLSGREEEVLDSAHSDARTTYTVVEDPRVVENGFRVRWKMDPSHHTALLHITSLTSLISHYGSEDLRTLLLALAGDPALTPGALRPEKAQEYFAREAKRKVEEDEAGDAEEEEVRGLVTGNIEWTRKEEEVTVVGVGGKVIGVKVWGV
ncbi:hypothetical protein BC937DRAFT_93901, partial [Endogone sp. FLAS-F59071]